MAATEEGQETQPHKHRAKHEASRTSTSGGTPNVCEEGDPEGQYGPWMVVHKKRNGFKGATPGKKLEGTSVHTWNSPLPQVSNIFLLAVEPQTL